MLKFLPLVVLDFSTDQLVWLSVLYLAHVLHKDSERKNQWSVDVRERRGDGSFVVLPRTSLRLLSKEQDKDSNQHPSRFKVAKKGS